MSSIHSGSIVRIRDWDDMAKEYGTSSSGTILCKYYFIEPMRGLCGKIYEVKSSYIHDDIVSLKYNEGDPISMYTISRDMLELLDDESVSDIDYEDFSEMLDFFSTLEK